MIFQRYTRGAFSRINSGARIGRGTEIGTWSEIGNGARLGRDVQVGAWAKVGEGAVIGDRVRLGSHAIVGAGAIIAPDVTLGSHTRIAPNVVVPEGAVFDDNDLVTRNGIISGRCSGYGMFGEKIDRIDTVRVSMFAGNFFLTGADAQDVEDRIQAYMWGDDSALEPFRMHQDEPVPEEAFGPGL